LSENRIRYFIKWDNGAGQGGIEYEIHEVRFIVLFISFGSLARKLEISPVSAGGISPAVLLSLPYSTKEGFAIFPRVQGERLVSSYHIPPKVGILNS
jgi:hypothetical protein